MKVWLEQGGIYAPANLRGGGEYGDSWHQQGMLAKKQNVFDDFHAVMRHLVEAGYTQVSRLAIEGGSNGGLLMGAIIAQHPHDFQAVISHVGIYDSLRSELSPNGVFNIPEFGTVKDPDLFKALYAYSPYHNLKKTGYPAILFMTGENDGRVDPMHSRKMTAALQYENTSGKPILLRTSGNTGHGAGTPLDEGISHKWIGWCSFLTVWPCSTKARQIRNSLRKQIWKGLPGKHPAASGETSTPARASSHGRLEDAKRPVGKKACKPVHLQHLHPVFETFPGLRCKHG